MKPEIVRLDKKDKLYAVCKKPTAAIKTCSLKVKEWRKGMPYKNAKCKECSG